MTADGERPIPVRSLVPAAEAPQASGPASAAPPPRQLTTPEGTWEVRGIGRSRTGYGRDAGALLLLVRFDLVEPRTGDAGSVNALQPREGLAVARSLDELDDEALGEVLDRARPAP